MSTSNFGERLKQLRREKNLTQEQLADVFGVARNSIFSYETGRRIPDIEVLKSYAEYFGVTSDYLLGLSNNRTNETAAIGDKLGLSDEAIEKLKLYFAGNHKPSPSASNSLPLHLKAKHLDFVYYYDFLKTLNILILDEKLLASLRNYIFTQIDPMILECDYNDEYTSIQTLPEERIELGQAVNMYQIQKNLIRVWEKQCKEETNAKEN